MTGLWPHTSGCTTNNVPLNKDVKTIAELTGDDCLCAYYGKWHLGDEIIRQHGFHEWLSTEDQYRNCYSKKQYLNQFSDYHHYLIENGFQPDVEKMGFKVFERFTAAGLEEPFTKPAFTAREAAKFIKKNKNRRFMLYVNFLEPHDPYHGPFNDLYEPGLLKTGPAFFEKPPQNASLFHRLRADSYLSNIVPGKLRHELKDFDLGKREDWLRLRTRYLGNITLVDRAVGVILKELEECGLTEDTIVVFTSDHGDMIGDHCLLEKRTLYEEVIKVPLLVRVPWMVDKQQFIKGRASQIDLVPTLLDLMGEPLPEHLQGKSLVDVLKGEASLEDNDVFLEWNGWGDRDVAGPEINRIVAMPWRTVISAEGWKLNLSSVDQSELYDLNTDPFEQKNLYEEPEHRDRIRDLTARIRVWQHHVGDVAF